MDDRKTSNIQLLTRAVVGLNSPLLSTIILAKRRAPLRSASAVQNVNATQDSRIPASPVFSRCENLKKL